MSSGDDAPRPPGLLPRPTSWRAPLGPPRRRWGPPLSPPDAPPLAVPRPAVAAGEIARDWPPPDLAPTDPVPVISAGAGIPAVLRWAPPLPGPDAARTAPPPAGPATGRPGTVRWMVTCTVASGLVPGLGQAFQRRWTAAALFGLQTFAAVLLLGRVLFDSKLDLLTMSVDSTALYGLAAGAIVWALLCSVSAVDAGRAARPPAPAVLKRRVAQGIIAGLALAALVPGVAVAIVAVHQNAVLDTVFVNSGHTAVALPSPLGELGVATTQAPTPPPSNPPAIPVPPAAATPAVGSSSSGRWTVALLGGDAGPRRWNLRTDTMIVVSIDRASGDLSVVSVPRNLERLPMPPGPLRTRFPSGFDDLANALYPYVDTHPELGLDPAESVKGSLAQLLGIPIDNYVLVDMAGFTKIIDALGGVDIDLSSRVPLVPDIDGKTMEAPAVGPGEVHMNGAMALAYSRTRELDSDYARMQRQRCLLAAVARETSATKLATSYLGVAGAVQDAFRSDVPRDELGDVVKLFAKVDIDQARTLALTPPVIQPAHPDIAKIRSLVQDVLHPTPAAAEPPGVAAPPTTC